MTDYDLVIVGAGSGNMLPDEGFDGLRVAIIERDRFGGTCLNRGCIPSKMLVYAADVAETVRHAGRYGVRAGLVAADWKAIRDRVFGRIDPLSDQAVALRRRGGVDVYLGEARFVAPRVLEVAGRQIRGEQVVLAVGSRPRIPEIVGLGEVPFHTSDTIMRVETLPTSMVVGGWRLRGGRGAGYRRAWARRHRRHLRVRRGRRVGDRRSHQSFPTQTPG